MEARGQHVQQEAAHELAGLERHRLVARGALDAVVLPAEGGAVDAGHYRSTGSADHLRFNESNCHAQRSDCNRFGAGRAVDYRIGLIDRIGLSAVESLEALNESIKWGRDELRATRDMYRRRARDMTRAAASPEIPLE